MPTVHVQNSCAALANGRLQRRTADAANIGQRRCDTELKRAALAIHAPRPVPKSASRSLGRPPFNSISTNCTNVARPSARPDRWLLTLAVPHATTRLTCHPHPSSRLCVCCILDVAPRRERQVYEQVLNRLQ